MSASAFLEENPKPKDLKEGIQGNICRCTGYNSILRAIKAVSEGKYEEKGR
jgi:aerobic-type carbon monoxide dehydrogenase small subunit (CoxS/CutS family)